MLTVRNRFRRRWLNEDIPEEDYYSEEDVSDRRQGSFRRQLSPAARAYNVRGQAASCNVGTSRMPQATICMLQSTMIPETSCMLPRP